MQVPLPISISEKGCFLTEEEFYDVKRSLDTLYQTLRVIRRQPKEEFPRLQEMCKIMCRERGAKLFVPEKSFLASEVVPGYFNQIKGKSLHGQFIKNGRFSSASFSD